MDAPLTETKLMSMEDWLDQFGDEPFEFVGGEKIPVSPSVYGSNYFANLIRDALNEVVKPKQLGDVYLELTIVFTENVRWVRKSLIPDIAFVAANKLVAFRAQHPNTWKELPLMVIPDLVVEVISPTDRYSKVRSKVTRYLDEGVPLIWVVDYLEEVVEVYTLQGRHELRRGDTLTAGDIIPGFELTLETLFT